MASPIPILRTLFFRRRPSGNGSSTQAQPIAYDSGMTDTLPTARVTRRFELPAGRLFDAWLDTGLLSQWMFGPNVRQEEIVRLSNDPREGGAFSFVVRRQANEVNHIGVYREISRPHRLVFTWAAVQAGKSATSLSWFLTSSLLILDRNSAWLMNSRQSG